MYATVGSCHTPVLYGSNRSDASSYTINGSQPCYNNCCPPPHCQDNRLAVMSLDSSTAQNYSNGGIGVTTETSVAAAYSNNSKQSSFYYSPMLPGNQPHVATVTASAAPIDHYKHFKHGFYSPGMSADVVTRATGGSIPSSPVQSSRDVTGAAQPTLVANGNESVMDGARTTGQQNHSSIMVTLPQAKTTNSPLMSSSSKSTSPPSFYQQMNLHSGIKQQQQHDMQQPLSGGSKSNEHEQTIPNGDFSNDRTEGQPDQPFNDFQVGSTSPDSRRDTNNKASYTTEPNESLPIAPPDVERKNSTNTDESSPRKPESSENFSFDGPQPNFNDLRESGSLEGNVNDSQDGALYQRYPSSEALTPPSGDDSEKAMGEGANSPTCQRVETHNGYELYYCHLCSYVGNSKYHFNAHMNAHFEHACPQCDYTSRTEGRLKRHIKDFHSDTPPNNFSGSRMLSSSPSSFAPMKREPGRPKLFRCRHCDFSSPTKVEFWDHARTHIKDDKILQCPKCPFVTEYKHHLEYHLRNHFGSKPFRCNKCNYACVNKSMLNSHMKSHTNVYQYRCADCTYATKYCHSLKLHLRKYNHHPATVLNADGSLPVDGSGDFELVSKRGPPRGPRGPRRESMPASKTSPSPPMQITNTAAAAAAAAMMLPQGRPGPSPNGGHSPLNSGMLGPTGFWAMMGHQQHHQAAMAMSHNGLQMAPPPLIPITGITPLDIRLPHSIESQVNNSGMQPPQMAPSQRASPGHSGSSPPTTSGASPMQFHCNFCGFPADTRGALTQHMLKVHAVENQDLFSMFGIHAESLADESAISSAASAPLVVKSLSYKHETSPPNVSEAWAAMMQSGSGAVGDVPAVTSAVPSMPSCHGLLLPPPDGGIYAMSAMSCASSDMSLANQMLGADSAPRISQFFGQAPPDKVRPRQSGERPLDLTKRRSDGEEEEDMLQRPSPGGPGVKRKVDVECNEDNSNMSADLVMPTPPRKRSRKGKAYKLDTLSLKMQDQYEDSPPDGDLEDDDVSNQSAPNYSSPANMFREKSVITDGKNSTPQQVFAMIQPEGSTFGSYEASPHSGPVVDFLEGKQRMREMNSLAGKMSNPDGSLSNMRPRSKSIGDIARFSRSPHFPPNCSIDPSSAYSLGMSRRKLFMIQQMEQQISSEQNPTGEMAPSPMATPVATAAMPVASAAVPVATAAPPALVEEEKKSKLATPVTGPESNPCADGKKKEGNKHVYECSHCEIVFRNCVMYTMHMGYHGYHNPLKCNMCGYESKDQLDFFLHIARVAHE